MAGRIVPPFSFSGGMTEIEIGGLTGRAPKNKLFRASAFHASGIMVQLRAEPLATTSDSARPVAEVEWQVGSGLHSALVDIGLGCSFTVSAAEVVEVSVRMNTEFFAWVQTIPYRCFGTAAPATAIGPLPARFSSLVTLPRVAGGSSSLIAVPKWAKRMRLMIANLSADDPVLLANTTALWTNNDSGAASVVAAETWNREAPFTVPVDGRRVQFSCPALGGADTDALLTWELEL